jgi:lipopolysaccharide export system permease protein
LREAFASTLIVLLVLLAILMSNQFAEILGDAAADGLPRDAVFRVFSLTLLRYLTFIAPVALLVGVLLALARLNRDSEMAALSACGIGPLTLLKPIGLLSVGVAAGVAWLAFVESPAANRTIAEIRFDAEEEMELELLTPGSFTTTNSGGTVLYVRESNGDRMQGVFIQTEQLGRSIVVLAEEGRRVQDSATGGFSLLLQNGRRYEGVPGEAGFIVAEFEQGEIPVQIQNREFVTAVEAMPTAGLLGSEEPELRAEFEWRLASPVSVLLLVLLAVPLSRSSPREGRYARVGLGLLLYIIYTNSLSIGRVWVERAAVPDWLGLWWAHGLLGLLALILLLNSAGLLAGRPRSFRLEPKERLESSA